MPPLWHTPDHIGAKAARIGSGDRQAAREIAGPLLNTLFVTLEVPAGQSAFAPQAGYQELDPGAVSHPGKHQQGR
jgi:hypothetical protein